MYERLKEQMKQKGYSKTKLALECKISPSNLIQALNGKRQMFPAWRKAICEVLNVDDADMFPPYRNGGL